MTMCELFPRLKPTKGDSPRFRELYAMDRAADNGNGDIMPVFDGYTDAFFDDGDAKAGTNLLRIFFIVGLGSKDEGKTLPQSIQDQAMLIQDMLKEQMPSSAAYYEALAVFFDWDRDEEHRIEAMFFLAMDGNKLAKEFVSNFLASLEKE